MKPLGENVKACDLESHKEAFRAFSRSKALSERTIELYDCGLRQFHRWLIKEYGEEAEITARRIREFMAHRLQLGNKPATVRIYRSTLRAFYNFLVLDEVITPEQNPILLVPQVRVRKPRIEPLTQEEIQRFLGTFNLDRLAEYRDYIFCLLILDTGLRAGEALGLQMENLDLDHSTITVRGKGGKQRTVFFGDRMRAKLVEYLDGPRRWLSEGRSLVFPAGRPSTNQGTLCIPQISATVKEHLDEAGVKRANSSVHRLRHTFAVNFLRNGGGVFHLQKILGHASLEMTRRYVMLADQDAQEAHRKASPVDRFDLPAPVPFRRAIRAATQDVQVAHSKASQVDGSGLQ